MNTDNIELGKKLWLKELIRVRGLKQYEVAKLISVDESLISKHINGARELSEENKEKVAKILGVKKEYI